MTKVTLHVMRENFHIVSRLLVILRFIMAEYYIHTLLLFWLILTYNMPCICWPNCLYVHVFKTKWHNMFMCWQIIKGPQLIIAVMVKTNQCLKSHWLISQENWSTQGKLHANIYQVIPQYMVCFCHLKMQDISYM